MASKKIIPVPNLKKVETIAKKVAAVQKKADIEIKAIKKEAEKKIKELKKEAKPGGTK